MTLSRLLSAASLFLLLAAPVAFAAPHGRPARVTIATYAVTRNKPGVHPQHGLRAAHLNPARHAPTPSASPASPG